MIPAFVIHHPSSVDRDSLVKNIKEKTGAECIEAILLPDGKEGCTKSHLTVAAYAKKTYPNQSYLVFEDDCVLESGWDTILKEFGHCDVVYLGYNDSCEHTIFGTHALMISPQARDLILLHAENLADKVMNRWAYDFILSQLIRDHQLQIALPLYEQREDYAYQKKGLKSLITGNLR